MRRLTLVLLVDALRHDYAGRMRYLRTLAAAGTTGRLREDAGFLPRASYFGGLGPSDIGFTNMFCHDPKASPFGVARGLPSSPAGRQVEDHFGLRQFVEATARRRVTPYAASYLWTAEIPLDLLAEFDLVEKRAPWDARVGYRSVFHELDDRGLPYVTCAWPESTQLADPSDRGILAEALGRIHPPCRLAYVHLQRLDAVGHEYGPESAELAAALLEMDVQIAQLVCTLEARFDQVDLVIFGDHGMVPVVGITDVWGALDAAGLMLGRDVSAFLDSTMARFWFRQPSMRARVVEALAPLRGRILDDEDLRALDLAGCDRRNGELIFLADPGVLISPNFFQRRGDLVRGMHGYHPDVPDNQGLFLVREAGTPGGADLGAVRPTMVYEAITRQLGLAAPAMQPRPHTGRSGPRASPFTLDPGADAAVMIRRHLDRIVAEVRRLSPATTAVLVNGSFGRGEGGVSRDGSGTPRPVNDYDLLVVTPDGPASQSSPWRTLGTRLADEFNTDFVHFHVTSSVDALRAKTLSNFDVRHGSQVLWGDPDALEALPAFAAGEVPTGDGLQLLLNRLAGLLTIVDWPGSPLPDAPTRRRYLVNQVMKSLMAIGDWHLIRLQAYACSYATRRDRMHWLGGALGLHADLLAAVRRAYEYKLHPDEADLADLPALVWRTITWLTDTAASAIATVAGRPVTTAIDAAEAYYLLAQPPADHLEADNAWVRETLRDEADAALLPCPAGSIRQHIYASMPLLSTAAAIGDAGAFAEASRRLSGCFAGAWPADLTPAHWQASRERLGRIWLTLVH